MNVCGNRAGNTNAQPKAHESEGMLPGPAGGYPLSAWREPVG